MGNFLKTLLRFKKLYEEQKEALLSADIAERLALASDPKTNKEILYYLAENDPDPWVRSAVANNKSMPVHVSPILAADSSVDVRLALAGRLVELLPQLSDDKHSQVYAFAVQALGTLALDEVLKIRLALSSTLKDHAYAPPKVAAQLARDVEREVSEPILRFCTAVSDHDLLDIIAEHPAGWVVRAIAGRKVVSETVSEAIIENDDREAGMILIGNDGAKLPVPLLQRIVERARDYPEWQKPMALRKGLPVPVAKEMAGFVDASVRDILVSRGDFDEPTTEEIAAIFRRRVDFATNEMGTHETVQEKLKRMAAGGMINEEAISDALAMREREFVKGAIAYLVKTNYDSVERIFAMKAAKPIVALSWHAGLSMRLALELQKSVGEVQPKEILYPKGGTDYPLTDAELNWQLEFLGLKSA